MLEDLVVSPSESDCTAVALAPTASVVRQPRMRLCSCINGRERWYVDVLENHPHLSAAVELVLQTEEGIQEARVNPVTGRVLVRYDPRAVAHSVERLLRRALDVRPLSTEEFSAFRPRQSEAHSHTPVLKVEAGCFLVHTILLGGFCPVGLACAAVLFLVNRATHSRRPPPVPPDRSVSTATN
jgi:ATP-binding cassette, subfamily B, bacterial